MRISFQITVILPLLVAAIVFCGCGRSPEREALERAEAVMEERPDSALAIVGALRLDSAAPAADRALHSLLLVQAMDKTHMLNTNNPELCHMADSMLAIAREFYDTTRDSEHQMKAQFYTGMMWSQNKELFSEALIPLSRSLELAIEREEYFWIGKTYDTMGDVFYSGGAFLDMVEAQRKALTAFSRTDRKEFTADARLSLAKSLISAGRNEEAIDTARVILSDPYSLQIPYIVDGAKDVLVRGLFGSGKYKECIEEAEHMEINPDKNSDLVLFLLASYISVGDVAHARKLMGEYEDCLDPEESSMLGYLLASAADDRDRQLERLLHIYDDLATDYRQFGASRFNTIQKMASDAAVDRQKTRQKEQADGFIVTIVLLILIGMTAVSWFIMYRRRLHDRINRTVIEGERLRKHLNHLIVRLDEKENEIECLEKQKKSELEALENLKDIELEDALKKKDEEKDLALMAKDMEMTSALAAKDKEKEEALEEKEQEKTSALREKDVEMASIEREYSSRLMDSLKESHARISRLVNHFYARPNEANLKDSEYINALKNLIEEYRPNKTGISRMERRIEKVYGNILSEFRKDFPNLKDIYYKVVLYTLLGLDVNSICYFLKLRNSKAVSNILLQIRKKIKDREAKGETGIVKKYIGILAKTEVRNY